MDDLPLHLHRQRGGHAVDVDLVRVQALGLEEELVLRLVGELDDLVFDGWAIARADALDAARVHGRAVHVLADEAQRLRRGEGDVAADLRLHDLLCAEAEGRGIGVAGLLFERLPMDGPAVEARRRSGLESASAKAESAERFAEQDGGGLAAAAGGITLFAAVDEAVEKCAGGDDGGAGEQIAAVAQLEAEDAAVGASGTREFTASQRRVLPGPQMRGTWGTRFRAQLGSLAPIPDLLFDHEIDDFRLADVQAGLRFEDFAHLHAVELLVALGARAPDGRAARGVEQAELDADGVGHLAHDAAQRVDFADQVALGHAADGRIAAHLRNQVEIHGDERGLEAHARGGHGRLAAGVSGAHYDHIVLFGESHPILFYGFARTDA